MGPRTRRDGEATSDGWAARTVHQTVHQGRSQQTDLGMHLSGQRMDVTRSQGDCEGEVRSESHWRAAQRQQVALAVATRHDDRTAPAALDRTALHMQQSLQQIPSHSTGVVRLTVGQTNGTRRVEPGNQRTFAKRLLGSQLLLWRQTWPQTIRVCLKCTSCSI